MTLRVLAIDPSLASLGYAYTLDGGKTSFTGTVKAGKLKGAPRLLHVHARITEIICQVQPALVSYEGYSMGKIRPYALDRAELGGLIKKELYDRKIPILLVPPTSLKLYATGKGNADKPEVMAQMGASRGVDFTSDDEADAYGLLLMGLASLSSRNRPRDPRHYKHRALQGCKLHTCED
jgi:crossover junction endodeoxyribonuclease RuvC